MDQSRARYEFGHFALDIGQQTLVRLDTRVETPLAGKVFDTLVYLVEHAGEPLDKDVLLRAVWPGVIVEENSLTQNISTLRQLLGEVRGENRYIATIPRKGYRFVAAVTRKEASASSELPAAVERTPAVAHARSADPRRRSKIATVAGLAVVVVAFASLTLLRAPPEVPVSAPHAGQTLAVLPFKPLLPTDRNEALELGMTESLIASLARTSPRAISPLNSVRRFGGRDQDAIAAGRALGVDMVLDGSLQRSGDRLRVFARLIRVADGKQLWAQNFDQEFTTIFELQDSIASRVSQALSVRWAGQATDRGAPHTRDPEAYALYASGRFAWTRQTEPSLLQAIDFFERAIARDPDYALAYTGLADSLALLGVFGIRAPREVFPDARRAAERALSIDPNLAEAHLALGHILLQFEHDQPGAARAYDRAMSLDPMSAMAHHRRGLMFAMQGDFVAALASSDRAQQLEPLWLGAKGATGCHLFYAGRIEESIAYLDQLLALDDRFANARSCLIRGLLQSGNHERALSELDRGPLQTPGSNALRAQILALAGRRDDAIAELNRVMERAKTKYVAAYDIALIHASLGDDESAFRWLERSMEDRSTLLVFLAEEPFFRRLRTDPRFAMLVERVGVFRGKLPVATTARRATE